MTWREVPLEASQHCNSESDSDDDSVAIDRSETDSDRRFCVRWFKTDSDRSESEKKQKIDLENSRMHRPVKIRNHFEVNETVVAGVGVIT